MIYIKHPEHGCLAVVQMEDVHRQNGWVEIDINVEIAKKSKPKGKTIDEMDKEELEIYARSFGVELDRRKSKVNMLADFEDAMK